MLVKLLLPILLALAPNEDTSYTEDEIVTIEAIKEIVSLTDLLKRLRTKSGSSDKSSEVQ